jgi:hypothetical protein
VKRTEELESVVYWWGIAIVAGFLGALVLLERPVLH